MFVTEMEKQQRIEEESILKYGVENGGRQGQVWGQVWGLCVCVILASKRVQEDQGFKDSLVRGLPASENNKTKAKQEGNRSQ